MIDSINKMNDNSKAIKYISHLINSQNKWLARIRDYPNDTEMDWWEPLYKCENLKTELVKSNKKWIGFLKSKDEESLSTEVKFIGHDGGQWAAKLKDIALQLIYHSFHHRAQIQTMIRNEGIEPEFIDYIGDKYRKIE